MTGAGDREGAPIGNRVCEYRGPASGCGGWRCRPCRGAVGRRRTRHRPDVGWPSWRRARRATTRRKGERTASPPVATVAQTGQVLGLAASAGQRGELHGCAEQVGRLCPTLPSVRVETRKGAAFFDGRLLGELSMPRKYSVSGPLARSVPAAPRAT